MEQQTETANDDLELYCNEESDTLLVKNPRGHWCATGLKMHTSGDVTKSVFLGVIERLGGIESFDIIESSWGQMTPITLDEIWPNG